MVQAVNRIFFETIYGCVSEAVNESDEPNLPQCIHTRSRELGDSLMPAGRCTRVGTLIVATIYLQLIQNRYLFQSFTVLQCSHQHCVQPAASDVEVVGYL